MTNQGTESAGVVQVWNDETNIYVRYLTTPPFTLRQTALSLSSEDLSGFEVNGSTYGVNKPRPPIDGFAFHSFPIGRTEFVFVVPIATLDPVPFFRALAYASLDDGSGRLQSAFGGHLNLYKGKQTESKWYRYFKHGICVNTCPLKCVAPDGTEYDQGAVVYFDSPCVTYECLARGQWGEALAQSCPFCPGDQQYVDGECCPVCVDTTTTTTPCDGPECLNVCSADKICGSNCCADGETCIDGTFCLPPPLCGAEDPCSRSTCNSVWAGAGECVTNWETCTFSCMCGDCFVLGEENGSPACLAKTMCDGIDCGAGGTCLEDFVGTSCSYHCKCSEGYVLENGVCVDPDECTPDVCGKCPCVDVAAPDRGYTCGNNASKPGVYGHQTTCEEVDGCTPDAIAACGGCGCQDVFSGETGALVGYTCNNPNNGYEVLTDTNGNQYCQDRDDCSAAACGSCGCVDNKAPRSGYHCGTPPSGYRLNGDTCEDIPGCDSPEAAACGLCGCTDVPAPGTGFICNDPALSYPGLKRSTNQQSCYDRNDCIASSCGAGACGCIDTAAGADGQGVGFTCFSKPSNPGFKAVGSTCVDVDGCMDPTVVATCGSVCSCVDVPAPGTGYTCASPNPVWVPTTIASASGGQTCCKTDQIFDEPTFEAEIYRLTYSSVDPATPKGMVDISAQHNGGASDKPYWSVAFDYNQDRTYEIANVVTYCIDRSNTLGNGRRCALLASSMQPGIVSRAGTGDADRLINNPQNYPAMNYLHDTYDIGQKCGITSNAAYTITGGDMQRVTWALITGEITGAGSSSSGSSNDDCFNKLFTTARTNQQNNPTWQPSKWIMVVVSPIECSTGATIPNGQVLVSRFPVVPNKSIRTCANAASDPCATSNCGGGTCARQGVVGPAETSTCQCPSGFSFVGNACVDTYECSSVMQCGALGGTCVDVPAPGTGYRCACPAGTYDNAGTCSDVNYCAGGAFPNLPVSYGLLSGLTVCRSQGDTTAGCVDSGIAEGYSCQCDGIYTFAGGTCRDPNASMGVFHLVNLTPGKNTLHSLIVMPENYVLDMSIRPSGTDSNWANLLRISLADSNCDIGCKTGDRALAIWFNPGATTLHIRADATGGYDQGLSGVGPFPLNVDTQLQVHAMGSSFKAYVNGVLKASTTFSGTRAKGFAKLWVSDKYYNAAKAGIKIAQLQEVIPCATGSYFLNGVCVYVDYCTGGTFEDVYYASGLVACRAQGDVQATCIDNGIFPGSTCSCSSGYILQGGSCRDPNAPATVIGYYGNLVPVANSNPVAITMPYNYRLDLTIHPTATVSSWGNILRVALAGSTTDNSVTGDRTLALWFNPGNLNLAIKVDAHGSNNQGPEAQSGVSMNQDNVIVVTVIGNTMTWNINGQSTGTRTISGTRPSGACYFFLSDKFYTPAAATIGQVSVIALP